MTETVQRQSATIYQFPKRGRFAVSAQRDEFSVVTSIAGSRGAKAASGSAWYHDQAIADEYTRD